MKLRNVSKRRYMHIANGVTWSLAPAETKEIDDAVAKIWLKTKDIVTVDDGSKDEEIERLKKKVAELEGSSSGERETLLAECKKLGIKGVYGKNVSIEKIKEKLEVARLTASEE